MYGESVCNIKKYCTRTRKIIREKEGQNPFGTRGVNSIRAIKSRRMSMMGLRTRIWEIRNAYKILVGKSEVMRSLLNTRLTCECN